MGRKSLCADDLAVIERCSDMVYRMAFSLIRDRYDAEDIHQEVFVRYLRKRPEFENEEHEKAWFLRVTINLCKNFWRTAWRRRTVDLEEAEAEPDKREDGRDDEIIHMVKRLPQKYRIVIHLFYYEELSVSEISELLHVKPSTVRTHLTRARAKLKILCEAGQKEDKQKKSVRKEGGQKENEQKRTDGKKTGRKRMGGKEEENV